MPKEKVEKVLYKIRIKDVEKIRCCKDLKMFAGRVVIAEKTPAGLFTFHHHISSGFRGGGTESRIISPNFVDVIEANSP